VLQDSENILSRNKINIEKTFFVFVSIHTETVAEISAPTPPVIGAS
jgi:hypothetical protein